jgi:glucosyl-dolichyl phosphate glucuronosyltransferase
VTNLPSATVVIPCYTEDRWDHTLRAIKSARAQSHAPSQVLVVVDHNDRLASRLRANVEDAVVLDNLLERGVSGARNSAVMKARTPIVAFLDDDATARPDWLAHLVSPFSDPLVVGTGGAIVPDWELPAPRWFPAEFAWVVGGSIPGLPTIQAPIRNVWSANMAVRVSVFEQVGGFRLEFGKVGTVARPEDTDLCIRMGKVVGGGHWVYVPEAVVDHFVPAQRGSLRFFLRRCRNEGRAKIELALLLGGTNDLGPERDYLRRTVPLAIRDQLKAFLRQRRAERLAIAGTMVLGLGAAAVGAGDAVVRHPVSNTSRLIHRSQPNVIA